MRFALMPGTAYAEVAPANASRAYLASAIAGRLSPNSIFEKMGEH